MSAMRWFGGKRRLGVAETSIVGGVSSVTVTPQLATDCPDGPLQVTETLVEPRPYGLPGSHEVVAAPPGSEQLATEAHEIVAAHAASAEAEGARHGMAGTMTQRLVQPSPFGAVPSA